MCGVFGYIGELGREEWRVAHELLVELALASEGRGEEAAGYAALTTRGRLRWERRPGPARELFLGRGFSALRGQRILAVIGHTRQATTGSPLCNENNHPHLAGDWALVHNGLLPTHREKAARLGLELRSGCDSELLAQALCRYGETAGPGVCLAQGGKQSVLALQARTRHLLAWTNGEMPLVAFRVQGWPALWWASTKQIAQEALSAMGLTARFAAAKPYRVYRMGVEAGRVVIETT